MGREAAFLALGFTALRSNGALQNIPPMVLSAGTSALVAARENRMA